MNEKQNKDLRLMMIYQFYRVYVMLPYQNILVFKMLLFPDVIWKKKSFRLATPSSMKFFMAKNLCNVNHLVPWWFMYTYIHFL